MRMSEEQYLSDQFAKADPSASLLESLIREADAAEVNWGPFRSTHEAYGVLKEELDEMFDAIRADDIDHARAEAIQVAAVAYRFARDGIKRDSVK